MASIVAEQWNYCAHIWQMRYFWFSLVCNDIVSRYRHSFLGIGWSLARPLAMTAVNCVVFGALLNQPTHIYAPFLMVGMAVWQFMAESLNAGCRSFTTSAAYLKQKRIPLAIFPLRNVLAASFHFLIALTLAILLTFYFRGSLHPMGLLYLIPGLIVFFLFCWFASIILALIQTHFPDTANLLEISLQILYFLTPIMYSAALFKDRGRLKLLIEWNPLYSLVEMIRSPILTGSLPPTDQVIYSLSVVALLGVLAWFCLKKLERSLVFWI